MKLYLNITFYSLLALLALMIGCSNKKDEPNTTPLGQSAVSIQKCGIGVNFDEYTNSCSPNPLDILIPTTLVAQYEKDNTKLFGELNIENGSFWDKIGNQAFKICNQDKFDMSGINCATAFRNSSIMVIIDVFGNIQQAARVTFAVKQNYGYTATPYYNTNTTQNYNQRYLPGYMTISFEGIISRYTGEFRNNNGQVFTEFRGDSDGFIITPNKQVANSKVFDDMILLVTKGKLIDAKIDFMFTHPDNYNVNWLNGKFQNCNGSRCI